VTNRNQTLMIRNGALIFFAGLIGAYIFLFRLIGEITFWPIPGHFRLALPGDERAWRAVHTGNIMNALMLLGVGLSLSHVRLSAKAQAFVVWGLIVSAWGNLGFYFLSAMGATGRGLTFGPNRFGGGDFLSILTFLAGYPGAFLAPITMVLLARGAFVAAREFTARPSTQSDASEQAPKVQTSGARS
jgi:hypothetical protein